MKLLYTILPVLFFPIFLQGQGVFEAYDHSMRYNIPALAYEYNNGLVVVQYAGKRIDQNASLRYESIYINFVDEYGKITRLLNSGEIWQNRLLHDIKFQVMEDSTLQISISNVWDYDIPLGAFTTVTFDGVESNVEFNNLFDEIETDIFWEEEQMISLGNDILISYSDSTFIINDQGEHIVTIDTLNGKFEAAHSPLGILLYNASGIYQLTEEFTLNTISSDNKPYLIHYSNERHVLVYDTKVAIYDENMAVQLAEFDIPDDYSYYNSAYIRDNNLWITLSSGSEVSQWTTSDQGILTQVDLPIPDNSSLHSVYPGKVYDYIMTSNLGESFRQTTINKLEKNTFEYDYDFAENVRTYGSPLTLDSMELVDIFNGSFFIRHYFSGELSIENIGTENIVNTNAYAQYLYFGTRDLMLSMNDVEVGSMSSINYNFTSYQENQGDSLVFIITGVNDRRLETPLITQIPIIAGSSQASILEVSIYPNPTSNLLTITSESDLTQIQIFDLSGKLVISKFKSNTIDVSNLKYGSYLVYIVDDQGQVGVEQFIKARE